MLRIGPNGTAKRYNWCSVVQDETPRNNFLGNSASVLLLVLEHGDALVFSILLAKDMTENDAMQKSDERKL